MTSQETVLGMVLSAAPIGESDRRLVILTKERGRISAFAKGARKPGSSLLAPSQPFSFGHFSLYVGRNSYTVASAEVTNYFPEIREDLDAIYYGMYFCEFASFLTRENVDGTDILKLLYQSLRILAKKTVSFPLVRYIFEIKIMALNGEGPEVNHCVNQRGHGKEKKEEEMNLVFFSSMAGGLVCGMCRSGFPDAMPVSGALAYTLRFILGTPVERLYTFTVAPSVQDELMRVAKSYIKQYLDVEFKSLGMLESV